MGWFKDALKEAGKTVATAAIPVAGAALASRISRARKGRRVKGMTRMYVAVPKGVKMYKKGGCRKCSRRRRKY